MALYGSEECIRKWYEFDTKYDYIITDITQEDEKSYLEGQSDEEKQSIIYSDDL